MKNQHFGLPYLQILSPSKENVGVWCSSPCTVSLSVVSYNLELQCGWCESQHAISITENELMRDTQRWEKFRL